MIQISYLSDGEVGEQPLLTWSFVILKRDDKFGPFFESFEEVEDKVSDVFAVRRLEREFFAANRRQSERLRVNLEQVIRRLLESVSSQEEKTAIINLFILGTF